MIIFLWKISQGLVQGYSVEYTSEHGRRGRTGLPHDVILSSSTIVKRARESSLGVKGVKMFNLLPSAIRNINSTNIDVFKNALDEFLSIVPAQPTVAWLGRAAESNCLLHQIPLKLFYFKLVYSYVENPKHYIKGWASKNFSRIKDCQFLIFLTVYCKIFRHFQRALFMLILKMSLILFLSAKLAEMIQKQWN